MHVDSDCHSWRHCTVPARHDRHDDGLKGLAGSALRTVLGNAAETPLSGAFWRAVVTLLMQSSSAVTMTISASCSAPRSVRRGRADRGRRRRARGGAGFPARMEGAARDGGRAAAQDEHAARARSRLTPRGSPGGWRGLPDGRPQASMTFAPRRCAGRPCAQRRRLRAPLRQECALSAPAEPIRWNVSSEIAAARGKIEGAARELGALQRGPSRRDARLRRTGEAGRRGCPGADRRRPTARPHRASCLAVGGTSPSVVAHDKAKKT